MCKCFPNVDLIHLEKSNLSKIASIFISNKRAILGKNADLYKIASLVLTTFAKPYICSNYIVLDNLYMFHNNRAIVCEAVLDHHVY